MSQSKTNPSKSCVKYTFISRKICSLCVQRWKRTVPRFFTNVSKQTARARSPGCHKHKQNNIWTIWWFSWSVFFQFNETLIINQDPHSQNENDETPGKEYPDENDSEDTQTKLLQFLTSWHKY